MNTKEFWIGALVVLLSTIGAITVCMMAYKLLKPDMDCAAGYAPLVDVCVQGYKP